MIRRVLIEMVLLGDTETVERGRRSRVKRTILENVEEGRSTIGGEIDDKSSFGKLDVRILRNGLAPARSRSQYTHIH